MLISGRLHNMPRTICSGRTPFLIAAKARRHYFEFLPAQLGRFLDLGAGGGRLLRFVKSARPASMGVALDFSPTMLQVLRDTLDRKSTRLNSSHVSISYAV